MRLYSRVGFFLLGAVCWSPICWSQSTRVQFREEKAEIVIPFTAVDRGDHLVPDLRPQDVRLFDNGTERPLTSLLLDDGPASVLFVIDISSSMKRAIPYARQAVEQILRSGNESDDCALLEFSTEPQVTVGFTRSDKEVSTRLRELTPAGRTSLVDATMLALNEIKRGRQKRKAIVILSDGGENHSRHREREAILLAMETDVRIYGIELYPPVGDAFVGTSLLQLLSENTGGRYFPTVHAKDIPELAARFDVHRFYRAMFSPPAGDRDGRYHRIELKFSQADRLRGGKLFWKRGYRID